MDKPKTALELEHGVVTMGLQRETTTTPEWGFDIICNGRLLQQFVKSEIGFCEEGEWRLGNTSVSEDLDGERSYPPVWAE